MDAVSALQHMWRQRGGAGSRSSAPAEPLITVFKGVLNINVRNSQSDENKRVKDERSGSPLKMDQLNIKVFQIYFERPPKPEEC